MVFTILDLQVFKTVINHTPKVKHKKTPLRGRFRHFLVWYTTIATINQKANR